MINKNKSILIKITRYQRVLPLALMLITTNNIYAQTNETLKEKTSPQEPQRKESKEDIVFDVVESMQNILVEQRS